ncbi:MAG: hypothetical protein ACJA01_004493, partial [Saprospiraceae bacterium]
MRIDLRTKHDDCESRISIQRPAWRKASAFFIIIVKAMK